MVGIGRGEGTDGRFSVWRGLRNRRRSRTGSGAAKWRVLWRAARSNRSEDVYELYRKAQAPGATTEWLPWSEDGL